MAEAKLLRQHKGRLEARMQILEDHNRQLEAQLQRLRQLLDEVSRILSLFELVKLIKFPLISTAKRHESIDTPNTLGNSISTQHGITREATAERALYRSEFE